MDTNSDTVYSHSHVKVDVEDKLQDNIKRLKNNTDIKVLKLQETIDMLLATYSGVQIHFEKLKSSYGKVWEDQLKQLNENIRNQEDKIKSL
jgi:archaellum component FlaC